MPNAIKKLRETLNILTKIKTVKEIKKLKKMVKELSPTIMYDAIEPELIPKNAQAVAGYVGGKWPTFSSLAHLFPKARRISIAISKDESAEMLDVEAGDAIPADVVDWVKARHEEGHKRPILYGSASTMRLIKAYLNSSKIPRENVRLIIADPTGKPHIPPGYDGCQWNWHALGRNLDQSELRKDFWG